MDEEVVAVEELVELDSLEEELAAASFEPPSLAGVLVSLDDLSEAPLFSDLALSPLVLPVAVFRLSVL
jgi:hypothetical protein